MYSKIIIVLLLASVFAADKKYYTLNFKSAGDSWTESSDTFHAQFNDGTNWSSEYVMFKGVKKNEFI